MKRNSMLLVALVVMAMLNGVAWAQDMKKDGAMPPAPDQAAMTHDAAMKHMAGMMEALSSMMKGMSKVAKLDPMNPPPPVTSTLTQLTPSMYSTSPRRNTTGEA